MSEPDFLRRLEDELTAAAGRQAQRSRSRWRLAGRRRRRGSRRARALVLVGAILLVGAGGTAKLIAERGEVGGPPSLEFVRLTPEQRAVGLRPLTRPVIVARGRLASDGRPWQLIGFQTTRGLCVEIDFPRQRRAGGCGTPRPRKGRAIDWQAQIAIRSQARKAGGRRTTGLVLGAVDPAAARVSVRAGQWRRGPGSAASGARSPPVPARVIRVRDPRLLAALGLRRPFAWYLAELGGSFHGMRVEARDAGGGLLGRAGVPYAMSDLSAGIRFSSGMCDSSSVQATPPRVARLVPEAVRARLSALRRAQRPSDLPPRWFMETTRTAPALAAVDVDAIRLLRRGPDGSSYYLVPTRGRSAALVPPPGCLRTLTPGQRKREADMQRRADAAASRPSVVVYVIGRQSAGTAGVFDLDAYRRGRALYGTHGRRIVGMAPDGVASVALGFPGGVWRIVPVVGNVWIVHAPLATGDARGADGAVARPRAVEWRDARGRVVRRLR